MLAGARALGDFHRTLMWDGTVPEYWASILWEQPMGHYAQAWFQALTTHYGLSDEDATYFSTHHEADLQEHQGFIAHGELNQMVLIRIIEDGYEERPGYPLEYCALAPVDLNDLMMEAVLKESKA